MYKTIVAVLSMCLLLAGSALAVDVTGGPKPYLNPQPEPPSPRLNPQLEPPKPYLNPQPEPPSPVNRDVLMNKFNGKHLKNGDTLKVVNGNVFVRSSAGKQTAVQNQILEMQDGTKITVQGGKIVKEQAPGTKR